MIRKYRVDELTELIRFLIGDNISEWIDGGTTEFTIMNAFVNALEKISEGE